MKGKTLVISGGTRGIGQAIVYEFAQAGVNIAFTYNSNEELAIAQVKDLEEKYGIKAKAYPLNISIILSGIYELISFFKTSIFFSKSFSKSSPSYLINSNIFAVISSIFTSIFSNVFLSTISTKPSTNFLPITTA